MSNIWSYVPHVSHRTLRLVGIFFIVVSILFNPFLIQRFFVPDGNIQSVAKLSCIFLFEIIGCFVGTICILKSNGIPPKGIFLRLFLPIASLMAMWMVLEYCSYVIAILFLPKNGLELRVNPNYGRITNNVYSFEQDSNLGISLKKNDVYRAVKTYADGKTIYDVMYTTDAFGRRIIGPPELNAKKHLLLLGCSFAFGEGLSDADTLQSYLQQTMSEYAVYNYAVSSYGPQQMLALLETGRLSKEVEHQNGIGLYVFVDPNNMRRLVGSASTNWVYEFPYYVLDKNKQIVRKGNFFSNRSVITYLYSLYNWCKRYSYLLKLINLDLPISIDKHDVFLTYKLIEKSKLLYERQFNGTFYVLIHPFTNYSKEVIELIQLLKANNIPVLEYAVQDPTKVYSIVGDGHPNGVLNEELSSYLIKQLTNK